MIELPLRRRASRPFVARAFAGLYGAGGLVVAVSLLFKQPQGQLVGWMLVPVGVASVIGLALMVWGARLPNRCFYALPPLGSVLIAMVAYGAGTQLRGPYAALFFWSISSAFYFFPRRIAAPNVPFAAALYALVLWSGHEPFFAVRFLVPMAALAVTALLIDRLDAEREQLEHEVEHSLTELEQLARSDPLTGLANRRELERQLERELARAARSSTEVALLMIDLDHFKLYNDTHGHLAGDEVLCQAARAWEKRLRSSDLLARYGGEEFVVVLPDCDLDDARDLAERVREVLPHHQTCSVGIAAWDGQESGQALLRRADRALLDAKHGGRDRVYAAAPPSSRV
jgi:diguanylate cyclase (GGDEF)-like protein